MQWHGIISPSDSEVSDGETFESSDKILTGFLSLLGDLRTTRSRVATYGTFNYV